MNPKIKGIFFFVLGFLLLAWSVNEARLSFWRAGNPINEQVLSYFLNVLKGIIAAIFLVIGMNYFSRKV